MRRLAGVDLGKFIFSVGWVQFSHKISFYNMGSDGQHPQIWGALGSHPLPSLFDSLSLLSTCSLGTGLRGTMDGTPEVGQVVVVTNTEFTGDLDQSSFQRGGGEILVAVDSEENGRCWVDPESRDISFKGFCCN